MKRDMELIRLSLLEVEGEEPKPDLSVIHRGAESLPHGAVH